MLRVYAPHTPRDIDTDIHIYLYLHIYNRIYICLTIPIISKNYTEVNESIVGWLNGLQVSMHNYMLGIC